MKKVTSLLLAALMVLTLAACGNQETGITPETDTTDEFLAQLTGSYVELFPELAKAEYHDKWVAYVQPIVGEDATDSTIEMLLTMCMAESYGPEAIAAYQNPEDMRFNCYFLGGVDQFTISGNTISGVDENGKEVFSHNYTAIEDSEDTGFLFYKTEDSNAGQFTYFAFAPDTPEDTYHIEFRYSENIDDLQSWFEGTYAYWNAAGILADYSDGMMDDCIRLFATEQLSGEASDERQPSGSSVAFAGGSGTEADPYQVDTVEQLLAFAASVNDGSCGGYAGQYISLTADLDLTGVEWTPIGNMADMETYSTMFLGTFDGNNHTISKLTYESDEYNCGAGLFGLSCGTIKNLTVQDAMVKVTEGTSIAIGGVVGYNMGGTVENVTVKTTSVTGNNCTGGIIGGNSNGTVSGCTAEDISVTVIGDNDFSDGLIQDDIAECGGLLIGGGFGGTITDCMASGTVKAEGNEPVGLGGIGGCLEMMDSITSCTADVTILSAKGGHAIGGLCGYAGTHSNKDIILENEGFSTTNYPCVIDDCIITVSIETNGATHVGGLVGTGLYYYGEETAFAITNCKVSGSINGAVMPGAIAGRAEGSTILDCNFDLLIDGVAAQSELGETTRMYESADQ